MSFDGSNDYVNCGNDESLNITDAITIEAWVKPAIPPPGHISIVTKNLPTQDWGLSQYWLWAAGSGSIGFKLRGIYDFRPSYTWNLKWQHIVGTYDGQIMKVFANGALINSYEISGTIISSPSYPVLVGKCDSYYFNGFIDEVRIYNRALSAEEIKRHYEMSK